MDIQTLAKEPLRVLIVEDSEEDADLLVLELKRGGYDPAFRRVDTAEEMAAALSEDNWDLVLSDYSMPAFTLPEALELVRDKGLDVPFVIVSATIGEEAAVAAMKAGAHDYVLKHNIGRLVPAVRRELRETVTRRERKDLEEQLRQAQKLESLGLLAGGVAHDFNNLLTGILGNASLVAEVWEPPAEARMLLEEVIRAGERAAHLTRQLLAYAGKGRFVVEPVDVSSLVREISSLVQTSISKKVRVILNLADDLPMVEADSSQIQQLVMNLLLNGAEASGDRAGTVVITTAMEHVDEARPRNMGAGQHLEPGDYICLRVQDNGCGMDEAVKARIFDPFFSTKFTGRGLGLSAVLGIVRSHRGDLALESRPGEGTVFEVLLPAMTRRNAARLAERSGELRGRLTGSGTVLLVDDEAVVRRTARAMLEQYGYTVYEAADGRAGVELLRAMRDRVVLVLLDLTMPVMGGEDAFGLMKQIRPDLKVVLTSGYDEQEATRRFAGRGVDGFIQKPYTSSLLGATLKNVLTHDARSMGGTA